MRSFDDSAAGNKLRGKDDATELGVLYNLKKMAIKCFATNELISTTLTYNNKHLVGFQVAFVARTVAFLHAPMDATNE